MRQISFKTIEKKLEKKEIKNENLDISSGSILSLVEVLRKNQQIMNLEATSEKIADSELKISVEVKDIHDQRKNI